MNVIQNRVNKVTPRNAPLQPLLLPPLLPLLAAIAYLNFVALRSLIIMLVMSMLHILAGPQSALLNPSQRFSLFYFPQPPSGYFLYPLWAN